VPHSVDRLQALTALTAALADALTVEEVGEVVVVKTVEALGAEAGTLALLEEATDSLRIVRATNLDADVFGAQHIPLDAESPTADSVRHNETVILPSRESVLGRYPSLAERIGDFRGSRVTVPLEVAGRAIGAYGLTFPDPREFSDEDVDFMLALAGPCAQALERARLFAAERTAQLRLAFLAEASRVLSESLDGEELLRRVTDLVVPRLAEWCAVDLVEDGETRRVAEAGATDDETGALVVELSARNRTLGSMAFATPGSTGILEELARRAAMALDNARLYGQEHEAAETLQRSLLPPHLPDLPGMAVSAAYEPGSSALDVGGDWYDVFALPNGRVGLVIGDVVGRGLRAAAAMGQLRNAVRAYALEDRTPATVLERVNQLTKFTDQGDMATMVYAIFDPQAGLLSFASAGHPPPLVVESDGTTRYLEGGRSIPTGVVGDTQYEEATTTLDAGATLVLYTDGLVERRDKALDVGLAALAEAAAGAAGDDVAELRDRVLEHQLPDGAEDDVAVLAFRPLAKAGPAFEAHVPAEPGELAGVRHRLRHWLVNAGADEREVHDVLLACGEACANVVEHAYGPADAMFDVRAWLEADVVIVEVIDSGHWRAPRGTERGHGMGLMRALMDDVAVLPGDEGTEVRLRRRLGAVHA
jgi:GAF domain-containing protein/anti-sigma regulatory factor (Ser/Thr protein kinase)